MTPDTPVPTARSPPTFDSRLLSLPNELQDMVLAEVDDSQSLLNVSLTNRHLQAMAEPHLYRDVFIVDHRGYKSFMRAIKAKPPRVKSVRYLNVNLGSKKEYKRSLKRFMSSKPGRIVDWGFISLLSNLENLYVKSYDLNEPFTDLLKHAAKGKALRSLKTCEIFPVDNEEVSRRIHWQARTIWYQDILQHPTLKELTLLNFIGSPVHRLAGQSPTPLQRLEIISSALSLKAIKNVLSHAQSLKELIIYPDPVPVSMETLFSMPRFTADVFESVQDSLQKLVIYNGIPGTSIDPMPLHGMVALRHLAIADDGLFGVLPEDGMTGITLNNLKMIFPPNVEIWEMDCDENEVMATTNPILTHKDDLCPKLRRISIPDALKDEVSDEDLRRFAAAGIDLTFDFRSLHFSHDGEQGVYDTELQRPMVICSDGLSLPISYID
ncbi:hypothetical protein IWZ01DRAFT_561119 [Phyllosticta capitalensis]